MEDKLENAIFFPEIVAFLEKHPYLHENDALCKLSIQQIASTANFGENTDFVYECILEHWLNGNPNRNFENLNAQIDDFDWDWFNKWESYFQKLGKYPRNWQYYQHKYRDKKLTKVALLYHSITSRGACLAAYYNHYKVMSYGIWKNQYNLKLCLVGDDPVEDEIVKNLQPIKNNQILMLYPFIPGGRNSYLYERIRNR